MPLQWECTCGAVFGSREAQKLTRHVSEGRKLDEEHGFVGLVDSETREVKAKTMPLAVKQGIIPRSKRRLKKGNGQAPPDGETPPDDGSKSPDADEKVATSIRGRFVTQEILLDGRLLLFYDLACQRYPEYDASVGEWIWDCISQLYTEHSHELGLGRLFEDTIQPEVEHGRTREGEQGDKDAVAAESGVR
ncbi:MAG: hypothetical protein ABIH46_05650 [Chloroflexota bacterium]